MLTKPIQGLAGRTVRCILFDLGDTLWYRKDVASWHQLEAASNQHAVIVLRQHVAPKFLPSINDAALGKHLRETLEGEVRSIISQNPEIEPNGPLTVVQLLRQWGIKNVDLALGEAIFEALRIHVPASRPLFDDVLSTLAALRRRGFQLGIVTNRLWGGEPFREDLQTLSLLNYFDLRHIAVSGDLGVRKPNPAIFLHVLNEFQVPPEEAVMVGDSLRADVIGGQRLGIFSIWKPKPKWLDSINAHLGNHSTPAELAPGEITEQQHPGVHVTDDDYVLAQVKSRDKRLDAFLRGDIKPDLIVEKVSNLLDMLSEVGKQ